MQHLGYRVEVYTQQGLAGQTCASSQHVSLEEALRAYANEVERMDSTDVHLIDQGVVCRRCACRHRSVMPIERENGEVS